MFSQERNLAALEDMPVPTVKGPPLEADQSCFSVSVGEPVTAGTAGFHRLPPLTDWLPRGDWISYVASFRFHLI